MTSRAPRKSSSGNTGIPRNMFFASLALHLIVFAAVVITVPGASRQLTFGTPYSVNLVGPEVMQLPRETAPSQTMPSLPSDRPVILKRSDTASKALPAIQKDETGRADIEKAIQALRQKELASAGADGANQSASGQQSQINDYGRFVWMKIKKNWALPASLMPKENVTTIIDVRIGQNGALEYADFEKRSGNIYFDESAMRAVKKSAPFPPLSGWVTGRSIEIGIRFHSEELR